MDEHDLAELDARIGEKVALIEELECDIEEMENWLQEAERDLEGLEAERRVILADLS